MIPTPEGNGTYDKPYISGDCTLVIPFLSDPRYHWWSGGQSIHETLIEIGAKPDVIQRYVTEEQIREKQKND
jgi:hypothetical protein